MVVLEHAMVALPCFTSSRVTSYPRFMHEAGLGWTNDSMDQGTR